MRGYPQFSFWISIALVKIYISCIIINPGKSTFELVGTVLNVCRKNCAISILIGSAVLKISWRILVQPVNAESDLTTGLKVEKFM